MLAELLVYLFYGYPALGAVFGVYFVGWGAARIDPDAHGMSPALKVLLWPASVALWPVLLQKVRRSRAVRPSENQAAPSKPTPALRRAHRMIWLLLAVLLPVGFIAALLAYQSPLYQEPIAQLLPVPLPVLVRSVASDSVVINLRRAAQGGERQLEIVLKQPFGVPSAVVRVRQTGNWRAVGLLNAPGTYRFPMPNTDVHPRVEIVDDLHGRTILTVDF